MSEVICPACNHTRRVEAGYKVGPLTLCRSCATKQNGAERRAAGFRNNHQKRCRICGVMFQRPLEMGRIQWYGLRNCPEHRGVKRSTAFAGRLPSTPKQPADPGPKPPLAEAERAHHWKLRDSGEPQDGYGLCTNCGAEYWGFLLSPIMGEATETASAFR